MEESKSSAEGHAATAATQYEVEDPEIWALPAAKRPRREDPEQRFQLLGNAGPTASNPAAFKQFPLRDEQQLRSLAWMYKQEARGEGLKGGLLADKMGYGKTATTIGLLSEDRTQVQDGGQRPRGYIKSSATLIMCPPHLVQQWEHEFLKFIGEEGVQLFRAAVPRGLYRPGLEPIVLTADEMPFKVVGFGSEWIVSEVSADLQRNKQLPSKSLLSERFPESLQRSSFPQKVFSPKGFQKAFGEAASLRKSPLRRVSRKPSKKQLPSDSLLSEGFPESLRRSSFPQSEGFPERLRRSSFPQKVSSPEGFQKAFKEAASLRQSPLRGVSRKPSEKQLPSVRRVSRKASEKQLPSESLLSEGFPESLRRSSFPQTVSSPKGFQNAFGEAAFLRKSPLRRVSRKPSEKQLPSESLLSAGFPESLRRSSFPRVSSLKGFQKAFGEAAPLRTSPLRRVSRKPSEKQLPSESLLSEGFTESLRRSSFPQRVSSPQGFQNAFGEAAFLRKSPLRKVSGKPSEKQLPSESLLSEGFPESLRRSSFPRVSSLKGFQKAFGEAASLKKSPLQKVSRTPSEKQLPSKSLLSEGLPESLQKSSFPQTVSSPKPSEKQLPSESFFSEGFPESLRRSSSPPKVSSEMFPESLRTSSFPQKAFG